MDLRVRCVRMSSLLSGSHGEERSQPPDGAPEEPVRRVLIGRPPGEAAALEPMGRGKRRPMGAWEDRSCGI